MKYAQNLSLIARGPLDLHGEIVPVHIANIINHTSLMSLKVNSNTEVGFDPASQLKSRRSCLQQFLSWQIPVASSQSQPAWAANWPLNRFGVHQTTLAFGSSVHLANSRALQGVVYPQAPIRMGSPLLFMNFEE